VTGIGQEQDTTTLDTPIAPAVTGIGQGQNDALDTPIEPAVTGIGQTPSEMSFRPAYQGLAALATNWTRRKCHSPWSRRRSGPG
jgi:hypothetical protein